MSDSFEIRAAVRSKQVLRDGTCVIINSPVGSCSMSLKRRGGDEGGADLNGRLLQISVTRS